MKLTNMGKSVIAWGNDLLFVPGVAVEVDDALVAKNERMKQLIERGVLVSEKEEPPPTATTSTTTKTTTSTKASDPVK